MVLAAAPSPHIITTMMSADNDYDTEDFNKEEEMAIIDNQELIASIKMLSAMLGDNRNTEQRQQPSQDEMSCLTDSSFPLSDIYELAENDIIFHAAHTTSGSSSSCTDDKCFSNRHDGQHEQRFRQLLEDYADLYQSSRSEEEKLIFVTEVVRIWRSQEPVGRFLVRTEPKRGEKSPYHDIGDESARRRTVQLLLLADDGTSALPKGNTSNHQRRSQPRRKNQDDTTASTSASSSLSNPGHTSSHTSSGSGDSRKRSSRTTVNSSNSWNRYNNRDGECFGGSFRMIVMSFFNKQSDDGVMNQFLP